MFLLSTKIDIGIEEVIFNMFTGNVTLNLQRI